jgi:hypothetical protein
MREASIESGIVIRREEGMNKDGRRNGTCGGGGGMNKGGGKNCGWGGGT